MHNRLWLVAAAGIGAIAVSCGAGQSVEQRAAAIEGCVLDPARGSLQCSLDHGGRSRTFRLVVPDAAGDEPLPLVFDLHGLTSSPEQQEWVSGFDDLARLEGFVSVHPAGTGVVASWNAGTCCGQAAVEERDDVGWLDAVREHVARAIPIDPRRVYATGLSNGGYLSHRLACERADVYAAIAPVAGVLATSECDSSAPVPVLQIHGTADGIVPYLGGGLGGGLSAPASVEWWAARNGCGASRVTTLERGQVRCERFDSCPTGVDVELCTVEGGGHTWPGGPDLIIPALGATSRDLVATEHIWAFFADHPMRDVPATWAPGRDARVASETLPADACGLGGLDTAAATAANLVLPGDRERAASTGGDPTGAWSVSAAEVFLPPIAQGEVRVSESLVEVAGRMDLGGDGRYAARLDLRGTIVTESFGILHLDRRVRSTGGWSTEGDGWLSLEIECGGEAGSPGELPAELELTRIDASHARLSWRLSSGLIGDVWIVLALEASD